MARGPYDPWHSRFNREVDTLRSLRIKAGLTQVQAAALCNVSRRTWITWEAANGYVEMFKRKLVGLKKGAR